MLRYTLKTLLAHKLRLVLSAVAVVIGVAMVSGTYVLTDTLGRTFDNLFSSVNRNTAVAIRGANAFDNANSDRPPIPAALLDRVRAVPGVRAAEPEIQAGNTMVVDPQTGQPLSNGGAPGLGVNYSDSTLSTLVVREGRGPHGPGEIAVDRATFRDAHLRLGDEATVLVSGKPARFRVVGVMTLGSSDNVGGATLTIFDTPTAQQLLLSPDRLTQISVAADSGVSQAELAARVRTVTGAGTDVVTGKQLAKESSDSIKQGLSFFNTFLLAFGFIALFVGAFIISNTFSMLIGQRVRELALLRALGAARKQVTRSVLGEALAVGVLGSTVGLGLGVLVAAGLKAVIAGVGVDIPSGSIVFLPRTVILGYAVGVLVTTASALLPALKASRVPPVAAMRDTFVLPARSLRVRAIVGSAVTLLGAAFMGLGLAGSGSSAAVAVGLGAALVFLGVAALSPLIAGPVIRVLGSPIRRGFGTVGVLSSANAQRNPRRTAATASALMIGLALV